MTDYEKWRFLEETFSIEMTELYEAIESGRTVVYLVEEFPNQERHIFQISDGRYFTVPVEWYDDDFGSEFRMCTCWESDKLEVKTYHLKKGGY